MSSLERLDCIVKIKFGKYAYILQKQGSRGLVYVFKLKVDGIWQEHTLGMNYQESLLKLEELWSIA